MEVKNQQKVSLLTIGSNTNKERRCAIPPNPKGIGFPGAIIMKAELANSWVIMCLAPIKVSQEVRDKYVACLIGDEECTDLQFMTMCAHASIFVSHGSCHWCFEGSCFHPFRPGGLGSAIFTSSLRGVTNNGALVDKDTEGFLDNRKCHCDCPLLLSKGFLFDSAYNGLQHLYEAMLEMASKGTLYKKWEDFRERYESVIDNASYSFYPGDLFTKYENNIRKHFDRMAERHYHELEAAVLGKGDKKSVAYAVAKVKFELATHFVNYWEKELYKEENDGIQETV